jgi:hypothetical protein
MMASSRAAIGGAIGVLGLVAGAASSLADSIDARLFGAWTTSQADCKRLFIRSGGALAYRQPVDKFAQAAIIGPQQIRLPASVCQVRTASHEKGVVKLGVECNDSISYTSQTVQIKVTANGEIVYSPTGDPALDTTLIKCGM